jgi:mRNA interferase HigB
MKTDGVREYGNMPYSLVSLKETLRVISKARLKEFWLVHPRARRPLEAWYQLVSQSSFADLDARKKTFGASVDYVDPLYVFDIGGNKFRLAVAIHLNGQRCYVRHVMTHAEYDLGKWRKNP